MPFISLDKAQDGMKLSRAAANESGVTLLEAGTTLTEPLIRRLLRVGVRSVCVIGDNEGPQLEEALALLRKRFEPTRHKPHMSFLEETIAEYIEELYAQ